MENEVVISIRDITKVYRVGNQEVRALNGVSLDIHKHEYVAIMGPSGSGKSTMMNLFGCLDTPTSGTYILHGIDVSKMEDEELANVRNNEIGFVFQAFNLLPRYNAIDNVALPLIYSGISRSERERRAIDALDTVDLKDRMLHRPNELSGGQKQRVALARALVNNPSIILADEPTGNLDSNTSKDIMELFEEIYQKGNTIVIVTHDKDVSKYARRIVELKDGLVERDYLNEHPTLE